MCSDRRRRALSLASFAALAALLVACGKQGDPAPRPRAIPQAANDLVLRQRGGELLFEASYPKTTVAGLPIRVELAALTRDDFRRILTEPEHSLLKQYTALLGTEGVQVEFKADAVAELARLAAEVNRVAENIGARRLATLLERLLEEVSFNASEMDGVELVVDGPFVRRSLSELVQNQDLSRYVL